MGNGQYEIVNGRLVPRDMTVYQPLPADQYSALVYNDPSNAGKSFKDQHAAYSALVSGGLLPSIQQRMQVDAYMQSLNNSRPQRSAMDAQKLALLNSALASQKGPIITGPSGLLIGNTMNMQTPIVSSKQALRESGKASSNQNSTA